MIKLLFWGLIGYAIYRYFQMREQIKAAKRQDALHRQQFQEPPQQKREEDGEYIDYEEVK